MVCWIKKYSLEQIKTLHEAIKAQRGRYRENMTIYRDSKPIELTSKVCSKRVVPSEKNQNQVKENVNADNTGN